MVMTNDRGFSQLNFDLASDSLFTIYSLIWSTPMLSWKSTSNKLTSIWLSTIHLYVWYNRSKLHVGGQICIIYEHDTCHCKNSISMYILYRYKYPKYINIWLDQKNVILRYSFIYVKLSTLQFFFITPCLKLCINRVIKCLILLKKILDYTILSCMMYSSNTIVNILIFTMLCQQIYLFHFCLGLRLLLLMYGFLLYSYVSNLNPPVSQPYVSRSAQPSLFFILEIYINTSCDKTY